MPTSVPLPCSFAAAVQSATPTQELVAFAHVALFTPALLSTLNNAALGRDFLTRFLELTARQLSKHAPHAVALDKGHLNQARKNQRRTKFKPTDATTRALPPPLVACATPHCTTFHPYQQPTYRSFFLATVGVESTTGKIQHTGQTGKFVVPSSTGNYYILLMLSTKTKAFC